VTDLQPGDEVFGSSWTGALSTRGTFAELTAVPASSLIPKPEALGFEEAAASVMSGLTALAAMGTLPGMRVLINGASGGVGTFAVQIARSLGAEVTGVCSTRNLDLVRSLGADHVIDYTREDFTRGSDRYDLVLDNVMNHPPSQTARVLAAGGVFMPNRALRGIAEDGARRAHAVGLDERAVRQLEGRPAEPELARHAPPVRRLPSGDLRHLPLADTAKAVAHMLGHHAIGKLAITN
jgi:NADPH:quinone reductase-like Zn-dependent oxidoreductase